MLPAIDGLTSRCTEWAAGSVVVGKLTGVCIDPFGCSIAPFPPIVTGTPEGSTGNEISSASLSSFVSAFANSVAVPICVAFKCHRATPSPLLGTEIVCAEPATVFSP